MIRDLLDRYGISPDGTKDQHFIDSQYILSREIDVAAVGSEDGVLEIGGGLGTLTGMLADRAERVYVVELDQRLVEVIRQEVDHEGVDIIQGDALSVDWPPVDVCVSNPPYNISRELVEKLGRRQILSVCCFQQSFVEKLVAAPGDSAYCWMTVLCNVFFVPVFVQEVGADRFVPEPPVSSAIVKLVPNMGRYGISDIDQFLHVTKALFNHARQKLRNAFTNSRHQLGISKEDAKAIRDELPFAEERVMKLGMKDLDDVVDAWRRMSDGM